MAKLHILKDENNSKKAKIKFNLFFNGQEITNEYCLGEVNGVYIQAGTHEIMLRLQSRIASWRSPQKMLFHVNENEEVAFVIKTSKALKFQTVAMFIQALSFLFFVGPIRITRYHLAHGSDAVVSGIRIYDCVCVSVFAIAALINIILTIYLVLMQKQQTIVEVGRRSIQPEVITPQSYGQNIN